jgi:hypothetical protein
MIDQELPMAGQPVQEQPVMQQSPVEQAQGGPQQGQGKAPYPADAGEAKQFSNDILQILYDERTHANIVKQLSEVDQGMTGKGVGLIAGHLVGNRVSDVRGQTGRKIEMRLVVDAVKAVIRELAEIAEGEEFFAMQGADKKEAFQVAISVLDQLGRRPQQ